MNWLQLLVISKSELSFLMYAVEWAGGVAVALILLRLVAGPPSDWLRRMRGERPWQE